MDAAGQNDGFGGLNRLQRERDMKEKELILPSVELLEKELQREQRRNRRR